MQVVAGPNPLEMLLVMLLGGGFGMPAGVPPTQEDALSVRVAPAECFFYMSWAGTGTPDGSSSNQTEQLLAEPEVRAFLERTKGGLLETMRQVSGDDPAAQQNLNDMSRMLALVQGKPGALYLSDVVFQGNGPPTIKAGGLLRADDDAAEIKALLDTIMGRIPEARTSTVQIGDRTFSRIEIGEDAPPITWGLAGTYLVIGVGDGSLDELMQRAGGQPPAWLTGIRTKLAVSRISSTLYIDVERIVQMAIQQSGEPEAARILSILGLDKVQNYAMVNGMDATGCVSRALLSVDGMGSGILTWIDAEPLRGKDLAVVGEASPAAVVFRLDADGLLDLWLNLAGQIEPAAAEDMQQGLSQMEQQLDFSLREDVLKSLGNTWRIFAQPGPAALINGWTIAIDVDDRQRLQSVLDKLTQIATMQLQQAGPGAPSIQSETVNGHTVHSLKIEQPGVPVAPAWCLTDDYLFITAKPQSMSTLLSDSGSPSLADRPDLQALFSSSATTLGMVHIDTRAVAEALLPMVPTVLQTLPTGAPSMDTSNLPSADSILPHLQPTLAAVRRTADGVELVNRQTLPGGNIGASAPVAIALLLPAVQAAREAARRAQSMNNLKQIALAMHNFHDTYRAFPASYSADADGKPLLSWRVHVLPFLEQAALYEQFHLDEPWDSPHNKALISQMPEVYRSPSSKGESGMTNYLGVAGDDGVLARPENGNKLGTKMSQITDGTSNTLMTVEVPDETAVIWTKPGDYTPDPTDPTSGLLGFRKGGFLGGVTDGSVRFIPDELDAGTLNLLFTKSDGQPVRLP